MVIPNKLELAIRVVQRSPLFIRTRLSIIRMFCDVELRRPIPQFPAKGFVSSPEIEAVTQENFLAE